MSVRGSKPYTNTTFTRRHDREAGKHRPGGAPAEPRVCMVCGAVYEHRRWSLANLAQPRDWTDGPPTLVVCPGCQAKAEGVPAGYLYLEGAFLDAHREEIVRLVENEAERSRQDNPLAQIIGWDTDEGRLVVKTTTEHLADRLGRAVGSAYKGDLRFEFGHEDKFARVWWRRD